MTRRQLFAGLFAAPLVALGWKKARVTTTLRAAPYGNYSPTVIVFDSMELQAAYNRALSMQAEAFCLRVDSERIRFPR